MSNDHIIKLLRVASAPLAECFHGPDPANQIRSGGLINELFATLSERNGFYAFESALLFRPYFREQPPLGLVQWNTPSVWKRSYGGRVEEMVFFAEDLFGVQFCLFENSVASFDPETGETRPISSSLDAWCAWILEDHR